MLSGIFRRRKAVAAAALIAGSALGAGVPLLVSHNPQNTAEAATTTITLQVTNIPGVGAVDVTFAKFGGITNDVKPCSPSTCTGKEFGTVLLPVVTLREPFATGIATYQDLYTWEQAVRAGNPAARDSATLTLTNSTTGTTIAEYVLENAWPTNVDVLAGNPQSTGFTLTLTGDSFLLDSPSG
jgi:hypothetical protein